MCAPDDSGVYLINGKAFGSTASDIAGLIAHLKTSPAGWPVKLASHVAAGGGGTTAPKPAAGGGGGGGGAAAGGGGTPWLHSAGCNKVKSEAMLGKDPNANKDGQLVNVSPLSGSFPARPICCLYPSHSACQVNAIAIPKSAFILVRAALATGAPTRALDSLFIVVNRPVRRWCPAGGYAHIQFSRIIRIPRLSPSAGPPGPNLIPKKPRTFDKACITTGSIPTGITGEKQKNLPSLGTRCPPPASIHTDVRRVAWCVRPQAGSWSARRARSSRKMARCSS